MMNENLNEMIKVHNKGGSGRAASSKTASTETNSDKSKDSLSEGSDISLTNFYDWFEKFSGVINGVTQVKAEVSNIDSKDSIIFKIPKKGTEKSELVSFYKPATRPILNLPPIMMNLFKNDTFEVLHAYNDSIIIKSYGVKTGLIIVFCVNVDGRVVPYKKIKVKKNVTSVKLVGDESLVQEIRSRLPEDVDSEAIQLLYKQAIKVKDAFTTKEKTVEWFLKRQQEVVDINHLLKIDNVLINVI